MKESTVVIVGASISGLACAACLQIENIPFIIVEKEATLATPWRNHYERLHLHTNKAVSNLPIKKFAPHIPQYPSRRQVVDYLEEYSRDLDIHPEFNREAKSIRHSGGHWRVETEGEIYSSPNLIIATGAYSKPRKFKAGGIETFPGTVTHSASYKSGREFKNRKVLVVGFGNSACEIAIDLFEQGAQPSMSVRSAINVIPRDLLGIPILEISQVLSKLPARVADTINAPILYALYGDLKKLGLKKLPYGPYEQIRKDGVTPVLDIGTIRHIREGHIQIFPGIDHIDNYQVFFEDGRKENFDAIVAAIGYDRNCEEILDIEKERFDDLKNSVDHQIFFGKDGLYFCGFWTSPTGAIREIALDANKIAKDIRRKSGNSPNTNTQR